MFDGVLEGDGERDDEEDFVSDGVTDGVVDRVLVEETVRLVDVDIVTEPEVVTSSVSVSV